MREPLAKQGWSVPVGSQVRKITAAAFKKFGFSQQEILTHWNRIVGDQLAAYSQPVRLSRSRSRTESGATLTVRAEGPFALELQHLEPQILERINQFYGHRAVVRLKIVQGPVEKSRPARKPAPKALSAAEREALTAQLAPIKSDGLADALRHLGEALKRGKR